MAVYAHYSLQELFCVFNITPFFIQVYCHFKKSEKDLDNDLFVQRSAKCIFLLIFILHVCSGCLYLAGCSNYR